MGPSENIKDLRSRWWKRSYEVQEAIKVGEAAKYKNAECGMWVSRLVSVGDVL